MMYGRSGLDRFKKAQALEPFSVTPVKSSPKAQASPNAVVAVNSPNSKQSQDHQYSLQKVASDSVASSSTALPAPHATQVGGGQSTWQPPDWAIEPRQGVYYLEVMKDGEVLDRVSLDKRRHIFGRQFHTCDFVLDHQSVSRQHAAVIPHKSGSVYVIDLGSAHGTFVANERLTKDTPVELEVGQSLRFAASTRTYILRKNNSALFTPMPPPTEIKLPPFPDPSDEEAVVAYNTVLNRYGLSDKHMAISSSSGNAVADTAGVSGSSTFSAGSKNEEHLLPVERAAKRAKKMRVAFRDQVGGELVEVVGISDGADVETEPGPVGVKEGGSLVGKYESLVQVTMIPKGQKEQSSSGAKDDSVSQKGVTDKLKQVLSKVKSTPKSGIYDDLYGESFSGAVGSSWARPSSPSKIGGSSSLQQKTTVDSSSSSSGPREGDGKRHEEDKEEDDLFGD